MSTEQDFFTSPKSLPLHTRNVSTSFDATWHDRCTSSALR